MPIPSATVEVVPLPVPPHPKTGEHFYSRVKWGNIPNSNGGGPVVIASTTLQTRESLTAQWVNVRIFDQEGPPFETADGEWISPKFTAPSPLPGHREVDARVIGSIVYVDANGNGQALEDFKYFPIQAV